MTNKIEKTQQGGNVPGSVSQACSCHIECQHDYQEMPENCPKHGKAFREDVGIPKQRPYWKPYSEVKMSEYFNLTWCAKDLDQAFAETRRR
jgi:hypothetical protein